MLYRVAVCLLIAASLSYAAPSSAQMQPQTPAEAVATVENRGKTDFRINPPVAQRAAVRMLKTPTGEGNALLLVEFAPGEPAPEVLTFEVERGRVTVRDDGKAPDERARDGIYTGVINVDVNQLAASQAKLASANTRVPIFVGRQLATTAVLRKTDKPIQSLKDLPIIPLRENSAGQRLEKQLPPFEVPILSRFRPEDLFPIFPFLVDPSSVIPAASLTITNPSVVNDPNFTFNPCTMTGTPMGKWTFGHLMSELANTPATGISAPAFTRRWLRRWEIAQVVNDFPVAARTNVTTQIINPWPKVGADLDLSKAPFKLVAIVNRVDLRQNLIYGGGSAGEARFVFALMDSNCNTRPFLVIFEYGIRKNNCLALKAWGQQWFDLQANPIGSAAFNAALAAITVQFTEAGTNPAQLPNRSSLNQLRTNEIALSSPWELREFRLAGDDSDIGQLREVTVKQTPDISLNFTPTLESYETTNSANILMDKHVVPPDFPLGFPFLGGAAPVPTPSFFWDGPPTFPPPRPPDAVLAATPNLRFHFSFNTCNGCHGGETHTTFTHVSQTGALSTFLTGGPPVLDPAGEGVTRTFNDLLRRQQSLAQLLNQPCFFHLFFDPLRMVH